MKSLKKFLLNGYILKGLDYDQAKRTLEFYLNDDPKYLQKVRDYELKRPEEEKKAALEQKKYMIKH